MYEKWKNINRRGNSNRKRKTHVHGDRIVCRVATVAPEKRRLSTRKIVAKLDLDALPRTVGRRLREGRWNVHLAVRNSLLRSQSIQRKILWAQVRSYRFKSDWEKVFEQRITIHDLVVLVYLM